MANHPFIGHHFFKIRIGFNVICGDFPPAIILRGSRAGNKISLKFSALQISLHNHQPMPPFAVHPLTPPLMLLTPFLPSFAEPPLTSIQIVLSSCSFPSSANLSTHRHVPPPLMPRPATILYLSSPQLNYFLFTLEPREICSYYLPFYSIELKKPPLQAEL